MRGRIAEEAAEVDSAGAQGAGEEKLAEEGSSEQDFVEARVVAVVELLVEEKTARRVSAKAGLAVDPAEQKQDRDPEREREPALAPP